jgi:hypothetical protein
MNFHIQYCKQDRGFWPIPPLSVLFKLKITYIYFFYQEIEETKQKARTVDRQLAEARLEAEKREAVNTQVYIF